MNMFDKIIVQKALKSSWISENNPGSIPVNSADDKSSEISQLIYDLFGGEILKTHKQKGWHFYNRINGERIDFTRSKIKKIAGNNHFEDIPSTSEETHNYFEQEEYTTFLMRFIWAFEEAVGLKKYRPDYAA